MLAWQEFDRAPEALLARRDAPPIDLAALANGYEHLAQAARKVVAALRSEADSYASELIRCTLCNTRRSEVPDMVIGPGKFICSECVELCAEILEEAAARIDQMPAPVPRGLRVTAASPSPRAPRWALARRSCDSDSGVSRPPPGRAAGSRREQLRSRGGYRAPDQTYLTRSC